MFCLARPRNKQRARYFFGLPTNNAHKPHVQIVITHHIMRLNGDAPRIVTSAIVVFLQIKENYVLGKVHATRHAHPPATNSAHPTEGTHPRRPNTQGSDPQSSYLPAGGSTNG